MPSTELYALPKGVSHYLKEVRETLDGDKQRMWPFLFRSFESFRPPSLMSTTFSGPQNPLTHVSYHTSPSLGWADLTEDTIPRMDDPRVQWLLRQIVLGTVDCVFKGRDDKFNATFCIWIPDQDKFQSKEEQAHHDWWCQTLFYSQAPMPRDMPFLESPGNYCAYWTPEMVHECAERERKTTFLRTLAPRFRGDSYGDLVASELLRLVSFIEFVEADGSAIYYHEYAS